MTPNSRYIVISVLLAGLLSACSPNPSVLQDRVYGGRSAVTPPRPTAPVSPAKPVDRAPPLHSSSEVVIPRKPEPSVSMQPTPVMPVKPTTPAETLAPVKPTVLSETVTPNVYPSSAAVKALMKTADAEAANGNLDKAAGTLERALRIESDNPDIWLKLAKINERQGKSEQAVNMLNQAKRYQEQLN